MATRPVMYENTAVYPSAQKPAADPAPPRAAYAKPILFDRGEQLLLPDPAASSMMPTIPLTKNPMYVPFEETAAGMASGPQHQPAATPPPPLPTTLPVSSTTTSSAVWSSGSSKHPTAAHFYENSDVQMAPIGNYVNFKDSKPVADHDLLPVAAGSVALLPAAPAVLGLYSEVRKKPDAKAAAASGGSTPIYTMSREDAESCLKGDEIAVGTYLFRASKT